MQRIWAEQTRKGHSSPVEQNGTRTWKNEEGFNKTRDVDPNLKLNNYVNMYDRSPALSDDIDGNFMRRSCKLYLNHIDKRAINLLHGRRGPLCDICQTLDLAKENDREVTKYPFNKTWDVIARETETDPCCPFCLLLSFFGEGYGYQEGPVSIQWKDIGGFFTDFDGTNLAFMNEETAKTPLGCAREVQPQISPALIRKWMSLCETHHEDTCAPTKDVIRTADNHAGVKVLRVIDTQDMCIVEATPGMRYLALSYVWGPVVPVIRLQRDTIAQLSTKGMLKNLQDRIPKTINDAIDLVRLIGERYLWVDSLCLIQNDDDDMLDGIAHMDLVYQCAVLTIIAACGVDFNAGLSGLHPGTRELDQMIVQVLPGLKMTTTTGVYDRMSGMWPLWVEETVAKYVHHSRGWTLQELVLSHRTLIFTEHVVYFRCRANCWSEDTIYDNFPSFVNNVLHSGSKIDFVNDDEPHPISAFNVQLFRYADRRLTKESDTIYGLAGITRFMSVRLRSGVLEGLFTTCFDISILSWDSMGGTGILVPGRRQGFPSWSWAGWNGIRDGYGRVCTSPKDVNSWLRTMTYIVWYKRTPGTGKLNLVWDSDSQKEFGKLEEHHVGYRRGEGSDNSDSYGRDRAGIMMGMGINQNLKTKPDEDLHQENERSQAIRGEMAKRKYHFLHFFAWVVHIPRFDDPMPTKVSHILGTNGEMCGGVRLDNLESMKKVQGPHALVLLSKLNRYDKYLNDATVHEKPFFWVMVIEWVGDAKEVVAERRGIGYLFEDCLRHVMVPGKAWKEIVLA